MQRSTVENKYQNITENYFVTSTLLAFLVET